MIRSLLITATLLAGTLLYAQLPTTIFVTGGTTSTDCAPLNEEFTLDPVFMEQYANSGGTLSIVYDATSTPGQWILRQGSEVASNGNGDPNDPTGTYTWLPLAQFFCNQAPVGTFTIGDMSLPVTLVSFSARSNGKTVNLNWSTSAEDDNEGFEVQRSADGVNWNALNFVASRNGADGAATYDFVDEAPLPGANFYRLKQMDFDGAFDFSPTVIAEADLAEGAVSVFPNPVDNVLNVRTSKEGVSTYRIINAQGAVVLEGKLSSGQSVDVQGLRAGNYVLSVNGQTTRRFVKK